MKLKRIGPFSTESTHERFVAVNALLLDEATAGAASNPRGREIVNFHASPDEGMQRMLNALEPSTYIRPHRHLDPPKPESFVLLRGSMAFFVFDETGNFGPKDVTILSRQTGILAIDLRPGVFHAFLALEPGTVIFEVKPGPYSPITDKDFAPFAPAPDTPEAAAYQERLFKAALAAR